MATWRVAKSITTLHSQLRPLAPGAPASSFGTVGDLAHQSGTSDHNPRLIAGLGSTPVVTAGDFPLAGQLDPRAVLEAIRTSRDPRVKYAISRGQMYSSYATSGYAAWSWRPYSGADGHFDHGHLSVVGDARADDTTPWQIGADEMGLTFNERQKLDAIFNLFSTVRLDTDAADDGKGALASFSVPITATMTNLVRDVAALRAAVERMSEPTPADPVVGEVSTGELEAAVERGVRRVLGGLDGVTPPGA